MKTIVSLVCAVLVLAGCATQSKWAARVGHYTYDQAVQELGPPDKTDQLQDGSTVAQWLVKRSQTVMTPGPYSATPGWYVGPTTPMYNETRLPARFLDLTFDSHKELTAWKEISR